MVVALDISPPMLEQARFNFETDDRVTVHEWDLHRPIDRFGTFDIIVSGFAIHHLDDERKRRLFSEVAQHLSPGGLFANLEVVASATAELHDQFPHADRARG